MRRRILAHLKGNAVAYLALFVALGGTSAYAANTVFSADIVNGEVKSVDVGDGEIGSADVKDNSLNTFDVHSFLGVDIVDGTITGADLASNATTPYIGRGRMSCNGGGSCTIFDFRPQGFTDNLEPGNSEDRFFRAPPGGLVVSDWAASVTSPGIPAGQAMGAWLIEASTSNVFLSCPLDGSQQSCTSSASATIPGGTYFWVVINTSYQQAGAPYFDFSFRARPAS
jgi:hypothetical protein